MVEFLSASLGNNKSFVQRFQREIETPVRMVQPNRLRPSCKLCVALRAVIIDKSFRTDDIIAVLDRLFPSA